MKPFIRGRTTCTPTTPKSVRSQRLTLDLVDGYRIYEDQQLETATLIRDLRRLEMPLAAIQTFLAAASRPVPPLTGSYRPAV